MSTEVISLSSSDEEDNLSKPPLKKLKTLNLTECTLSVVPNKSKKKPEPEISVVIESDEESEEKLQVMNSDPRIVNSKQNCIEYKDDVDLIMVTDDENDEFVKDPIKNKSKMNNKLKSNCKKLNKNADNTVAIIDSDSDIETSVKNSAITNEFPETFYNSIMINDSDEEIEKQDNGENNNNNKGFAKDEDNTISTEEANNLINIDESKTLIQNGKETGQNDLRPSTSQAKVLEINDIFEEFLQLVEDKVTNSAFEEMLPKKMPIIKKYFNKCEAYVKEKDFRLLLRSCIDEIKKSLKANVANSAVISFHKVCKELKAHICQTTVEIEEENVSKVKLLEKTIHLLNKKIKQLEETEVDFEADKNSSYIQLDRYQNRLTKVYKKYCNYIKRNPYIGRPIYDRITFVNSNCNIINQALTKKYNNSLNFPSYYELRNYIEKVVGKHKLGLTDEEITIESKKCFKYLGSILQKKRRQELYDSHLAFIESSEDPAKNDILLENALKKSQKEGEEKIKEVCQKYVDLADRGEDKVSSETDSSNKSESEEDEERNNRSHNVNNKENGDEDEEKEVDRDSNICATV